MEGVHGDELMAVKKALQDQGAHTKVISKALGTLKSVDGNDVKVDMPFITTASVVFDAIYVPGGKQSIEALKDMGDALHFLNEAFKHCKPIGATSEGVDLLMASDIKGTKLAEQSDSGVVADQGVISVRGAADLDSFSKSFAVAIAKHRFWMRPQKMQVPA